MADSQTKHVSFEQIFIDTKQRKAALCPKTKSIWRQKRMIQTLEPLAKCKKLFTKKVARINEDYKFCTALDPNLIPPPPAKWKVICKNKDVAIPIMAESTIIDYQIFTFLSNS